MKGAYLLGQQISELLVQCPDGDRLKCLCSCGNTTRKSAGSLASAKSKGSFIACPKCVKAQRHKNIGNAFGRRPPSSRQDQSDPNQEDNDG